MAKASSALQTLSEELVGCKTFGAASDAQQPWPLGPFDFTVAPIIPTAIIFLYERPSGSQAELISSQKLRTAVELLLENYPHLTGRLTRGKQDNAPQIESIGAGALYTTAECSSPLKQYSSSRTLRPLISAFPDSGNALLPPISFSSNDAYKGIPFAVKHTRFACGSVAIAVSVLHVVADAAGYFRLTQDLADLYRQSGETDRLRPRLQHAPNAESFLGNFATSVSSQEHSRALRYTPRYYQIANTLAPTEAPPDSIHVTGKIFRFDAALLSKVKAAAAHGKDALPAGTWISTFDALAGLMYQHIFHSRAERLRQSHEEGSIASLSTNFLTSVDVRTRMGLESSYIPNAITTPFFSWPSGAEGLLTASLHDIAFAVHQLSQTQSSTEIESTLHWIAVQPDKTKIEHKFGFGQPACMLSAWNKFESYDTAVLDGVRPSVVAAPFTTINLVDGLVYFLQTEERPAGSSIDVHVALDDRLWPYFEQQEWIEKAELVS